VLDQKQLLSIDYIQRVLWEAACALGHAQPARGRAPRCETGQRVTPLTRWTTSTARLRCFREDIDRALRVGGGKARAPAAMARRPRQQFAGVASTSMRPCDDDGAGADRLNIFRMWVDMMIAFCGAMERMRSRISYF